MLGRRNKQPVLAEVPLRESSSGRPGALGRNELGAFAELAGKLSGKGSVFLTGPGRATAALGLGAAATAEGRRVALLECDLAQPVLAATLGLVEGPGLHEYLRDEADAHQILQPLVLAGPAASRATEPLTCIVAGEPEPQPVALLDSERCDHAIERLRRAYDLLVIAGPSLEEDADALRALGEHVAVTLVCGERGQIPKRLPIAATGMLLFTS
jgi:MinD-like ATPase involved in chromosome partitioning or flagellar assembly